MHTHDLRFEVALSVCINLSAHALLVSYSNSLLCTVNCLLYCSNVMRCMRGNRCEHSAVLSPHLSLDASHLCM